MNGIRPLVCVCALLLGMVGTSAQAAPTTEIIALDYSLAESLIPVIEPMLEDNERVSAYGNQLVIRAEPERIAEIRQLLATLDRQPAKLLISVASSSDSLSNQQGYSVDGRIRTGPAEVIVGNPGRDNQARIIRRETRGQGDGVRQVTVNEGYPVLIQSGQSVPLTQSTTTLHGQVISQTQYHDVTEGFYATVRLHGDQATITLSANNDRLNPNDRRVIDVRQTNTVVTARLGEWVTVGALDSTAGGAEGDIGRRTSTRSQEHGSLRLKVDRLD